MILSRVPKVLFLVVAAAVIYFLLSAVHFIGIANAQTVEAPPPVAPVLVTGFQLETWLLAAVAIFTGLIAVFSGIRTILAFVAPRTATTFDDRALERVTWLENSMRDLLALITGGRVPVPLPVAPPSAAPPRDPQSGRVRMALITGLALVCGVAVLVASCATARQRGAAGVTAFLECQSPNVDATLLEEAKGVTISAIDKWISGAGHVDTAGLRAEARPLKSDLMRCAFEAAIAALLLPAPVRPDAPAAAPRSVDTVALRAEWASIRAELGWAPLAANP